MPHWPGGAPASATGRQAYDAPSAPAPERPLASDALPLPPGQGAAYHLPALSAAVAGGAPVAGLRCGPAPLRPAVAHVELYARGLVLPVPAGIGVAPPVRRQGAYVSGGSCEYPLATHEPTGLVRLASKQVAPHVTERTLGSLFAIWGQPLSAARLAGFRGRVRAYVGGRRWRGDPRAIPVLAGAEIVVEVGRRVPPHRRYVFPP